MPRPTRVSRAAVAAVLLILLLSGCAADANPDVAGDGAGLWLGLWHGLILPVTFVVSLFNDSVGIYQVRNTGHLYDLGFVLGAGGLSLPGFLSGRRG